MLYELLVVANVGDAEGIFSKIEKTVKDVNAQNVKTSKLGKKQLAYPINRQTEAEYYLFNFEAEGESINTIASKLRLEQEAILRYLITKVKINKSPRRIRAASQAEVIAEPEVQKETKKVTVKAVAKVVKEEKAEVKKVVNKKETKPKKLAKGKK